MKMYEDFRVSGNRYLVVTRETQGLRNQFRYITWMIVYFDQVNLTYIATSHLCR